MVSETGNDPEQKKDPHLLNDSELIGDPELISEPELIEELEPNEEPGSIEEPEPERELPPMIPTQGVSRGLKTGVIIFTIITIGALIAFAAIMVKRVAAPKVESRLWGAQLLTVAEKLKDAGLHEQAIEQYEKFLANPKLDMKIRGEISLTLGSLFMELGNCREALSWLYQSEAAFPDAPWKDDLVARIDGCLHQLNNTQ